jgi:hypothetical protein
MMGATGFGSASLEEQATAGRAPSMSIRDMPFLHKCVSVLFV